MRKHNTFTSETKMFHFFPKGLGTQSCNLIGRLAGAGFSFL